MLNTSCLLEIAAVPQQSDHLRVAERGLMSMEESQSPQLAQPDIQSSVRLTKDMHSESLHKVLQKAASCAHKVQCWQSRTSPHNLFLEGFRDCASEVIRFLTEEERVEDNNPLLLGLQCHLKTVSKAICQETIMDLDRHDAQIEAQSINVPNQANLINKDQISVSGSSSSSHCMISPILSRSANTSTSDNSVTESDVSMSVSSVSDISSLSVSLQQDSPAPGQLKPAHWSHSDIHSSQPDHQQHDDVFHIQALPLRPPHQPKSQCLDQNLDTPTTRVQSLRQLALSAVSGANLNILNSGHQTPGLQTASLTNTSVYLDQVAVQSSVKAGQWSVPAPFLPPIGQSSPLLTTSVPSWSQLIHNPLTLSQPSPMTHTTTNIPFTSPASSHTGLPYHEADCHSQSHSLTRSQSSLSPQRNQLCSGQMGLEGQTVFDPAIANVATGQHSPGLYQQLSSILELKANFLPGIDTFSVASGNFADILLAVESCRFHDDPRVRALADELTHLIHNDGEDDDDDDDLDDDEYPSDDEDENINDIVRENDDESGIEMMDESADWGNAADMIEQ